MKQVLFLLLFTGIIIGQSKQDILNNLQRGGAIDIQDASPTTSYDVLTWDGDELKLVTIQVLGNTFTSILTTSLQAGTLSLDSALSVGKSAFTTTDETDTVLIAGATANDFYFIQPISETLDAQDNQFQVNAKADTLVVTRPASGASGLAYYWIRVKSY